MGSTIRTQIEQLGYSGSPIKVLSSPLLRCLQTAVHLHYGITSSKELDLLVNDNLSVKLKANLNKNPLEHGALATY